MKKIIRISKSKLLELIKFLARSGNNLNIKHLILISPKERKPGKKRMIGRNVSQCIVFLPETGPQRIPVTGSDPV